MEEIPKHLTLEGMSEEDFGNWKQQHLNRGTLSRETLIAIKIALSLSPGVSCKSYVDCCESHLHTYQCLGFSDRKDAVFQRLIEEIELYKKRLDEIREKADYTPESRY